MAILNYTTSIDCWTTVGEIQQILARSGASHFSTANKDSLPVACSFTLIWGTQPLNFTLPVNFNGVRKHMEKDQNVRKNLVKSGKMAKGLNMEKHAINVGWRILKDWIEAQCAIVQAEMASLETVFMQYLVIDGKGTTLADKILHGGGLKMLGNE